MRFVTGAAVWPDVSKGARSGNAARPSPDPSRKREGELATLPHGVGLLHQRLQHVEHLAHVLEMQARGRLVEDVEVLPVVRQLSSLTNLTRCASPPERVVPCWPTLA